MATRTGLIAQQFGVGSGVRMARPLQRILMMLIASVVAVVRRELELGTVSHVVSAAVRIAVVTAQHVPRLR